MKLPLLASLLSCIALQVQAADISVIGLFPGKAVLVIDGGSPKTYTVGNTVRPGIKLVDVNQTTATFDTDGKKQRIDIGGHVNRIAPSGASSVTLQADGRGHFMVQGQINGGTMRMLVDTGASLIALPAADARRLGIDYKKGQTAYVNTANGVVTAYQVVLNSVKIGDITLNQVDALVQENGLTFALLGMSFLNRTEMRREGEQMVLTKRY
ncbi:TIGR02281 family clan AA aspartic protease [Herminiimonas sp. NPDC097707]|uniref:retropepsin-like aspartic protease family protein n=1 Tax=Herminiimonas sp. NPDC097707 TaxID=3364007 RepID=UPI00383A6111